MEKPENFVITCWCGIPPKFIRNADGSLATERLAEMKNAGLNLIPVYDYGYETNREVLRECEKLGLKVLLIDDRVAEAQKEGADRRALISAVVKDYSEFAALDSYYVKDEPSSSDFPILAEIRDLFAELDPKHHAYVNLFPNYCSARRLGNDTYEEHVREYTDVVRPSFVSYDHYHFLKPKTVEAVDTGDERENDIIKDALKTSNREGFFNNAEDVRKVCLEKNIPFMVIILLVEHLAYRNPTEAEIRWEAWQSVAYGAKMLSYFTYWTPSVDGDDGDDHYNWQHGMINKDGTRDPHYDMVKRINVELQTVGDFLLPYVPEAVFHLGGVVESKSTAWVGAYREVEELSASELTVSFYPEGYLFLANKDYIDEADVKLRVKDGMTVTSFDKATGVWTPVAVNGNAVELTIAAGDAALLRIE